MPLHEKRFDPQGKLVVAKADGLRFGGRTYRQGESLDGDPTVTMRKLRQLYFQNKLCYDYELAAKAEEIAEARRARELAAARVEQDRLMDEAAAAAQAEQDRIDFEARAAAHAAEVARAQRAADEASGRVPATEPVIEPVVETAPVVATPAEAVSEAPVVVEEQPAPAEEMVLSPADSVVFAEAVTAQPEVAPAPRRRRASSAAGDTSVPATDAPPADTLVGDGIGALE
jgi:hypothetical protein